MTRDCSNATCTLCLWVDDFLGWSTHKSLIVELKIAVENKYGDARFDDGPVLNYIGMTITQVINGNQIHVRQTEHIKKVIHAAGVIKTSPTPISLHLMKRKKFSDELTATSNLLENDKKTYLSILMSLMYIAKRTRPDILTPVCILSTRVQTADLGDMKSLMRIVEYLNGTQDTGLIFSPHEIKLTYWIDASYNLHADSRGHTGVIVTVGKNNSPIHCISQKQKVHTRSSSEAELVAADTGVLHLLWLILVYEFLGYPQTPVTIMQDNMSTMAVCQTGQSKSGRLKHMVVRYNFIHGQQEDNIITFEHIESPRMLADIMSKPVDPPTFRRLASELVSLCKA